MNAKAVQIAAKMYEARDALKRLVGDKFRERIEPWQAVIRGKAEETGKDELHAVMDLMQDMQRNGVTSGQMGLLAAYVEMNDPSEEVPMKTVSEHIVDVCSGRAKAGTINEACGPVGAKAVVPIRLEFLIVDHDTRRCIDDDRIPALAQSISELGLLQPIGVRREPQTKRQKADNEQFYRVAWGAHRVAAVETLGWREIPAVIVDLDQVHAELAEIDENLVRSPLSALEEAQAIARRKEIYEVLHPETKRGAKGGRKANRVVDTEDTDHTEADSDGQQEQGDASEVVAGSVARVGQQAESGELRPTIGRISSAPSFIDDTAEKTGKSRSSIAAKAKLGREILPDVAKAIKKTPVAGNAKELAKLARLEPEQQRTVAKMLQEGEVDSVTAAIAEPPGPGETAEAAEKPRKPSEKRARISDKPADPEPTESAAAAADDSLNPLGAGSWLRERLCWLIDKYRTEWPVDGTSILAAAILEGMAAELREGFVESVAMSSDPMIGPRGSAGETGPDAGDVSRARAVGHAVRRRKAVRSE